jgi:hypothetical protein
VGEVQRAAATADAERVTTDGLPPPLQILIGLMSFMYEESTESIGSLLEPLEVRRRMARDSEYFNRQVRAQRVAVSAQ